MNNINIIVMGKTGVGKSTLINAVLGEEIAPVGTGQSITKEIKVYSKKTCEVYQTKKTENTEKGYKDDSLFKIYDTVGLEIDEKITKDTLHNLEQYIKITKKETDINTRYLIWFCINSKSHRLEDYEIKLIKQMSIEYEIPFIIVLTQSASDEEGELERYIQDAIPEINKIRVLARSYINRGTVFEAYGISELLELSIDNYNKLKTKVLEEKISELQKRVDKINADREIRLNRLEMNGECIIRSNSYSAKRIGYLPVGCIPIIHGICIKMIIELNDIFEIKGSKDFAADIFVYIVTGIVVSPFMAVPVFSSTAAASYVESIGENYLRVLLDVFRRSNDKEIKDMDLMRERIKTELKNERSGS